MLDLVLLMGSATSGGVFWGVSGLSTTSGCLSAGGWSVFLSCLSFGMRDLVLGTEGSWMEPGLGVEKDTSGRTVID